MNFIWILSSIFLALISYFFASELEGHIYVLFFISAILLTSVFKKKISSKLSLIPYIIGVICILFVEPLHEDDHYRYLWEGKVVSQGENPYTQPPIINKLDHIEFEKRDSVAFSHLTTVYPPLALIFFAISSPFNYEIALRVLMLLNALLIWILLQALIKKKSSPYLIALSIPYLQKEFIGAVHIDFFAAFLLFLPMLITLRTSKREYILIASSLWVKITSLFALPILIFQKERPLISTLKVVAIPLSLVIALALITGDLYRLSGVISFGQKWIWNPGFFGLLHYGFEVSSSSARSLCLALFVILTLLLYLHNIRNQNLSKSDYLLLIYSLLMFLTPVYNAWYGIWLLIPALLLGNFWAVLYALASSLSYLYYGMPELKEVVMVLTHLPFIMIIYGYRFILDKKKEVN